ncbi:ABC transporter ATP-binding protein [uncultured Roseobacter sp.]|uniref:ABC transporter ATP-binding protein n=1 Tax=uncultured Roseobacter sp. TaxID=114847 RepID=UPI0026031C88|nr:ABC transporter ATP-binding protein [uncultured Roseobacter sp.]
MSAPGISLEGQHSIGGLPLFDAELMIPAARWTCLLGRSGVGKSTILRLILGLETGGVFTGRIAATDGAALTGRITYMAQSDLLLPWLTVRENVCIGARLRGERVDVARASALLDRVGLGPHAGKRPPALSGGMRQRAALARTLFEDRPVVLLDEPFSALDAGTRADMQELAAALLQGRTVLLVTHDPAEAARLGHGIVVMSAQGMTAWPAPRSATPRPVSDAEALDCQTRLLDHLRHPRAAA